MRSRLGSTAVLLIALTGCGGVGSLDCAEIGEKARQLSQAHDMKITSLDNLRETSRSETEARCAARARWSDNAATDVYVRAYEESGNTMVAYQIIPFE